LSTRALVDPELLPTLDLLGGGLLTDGGAAAMRARLAQMRAAAGPLPAPQGVTVSERQVPGPVGAPPVRVLVVAPDRPGADRAAVLHLHGGGYVAGDPEQTLPQNARMATALDAVVVSVDYRLAPETRFPGPVEDAYAALLWLQHEAGGLGVDAARIAVTGESAGGGLAAALALLARDRGQVRLKAQLLSWPMLDDRSCLPGRTAPGAGEFVWTLEDNRYGWRALLGHEPGAAGVSPYAAAARAASLAGLPPAFLSVGALDLFLDEDVDYARRLIAAGVPTELHVYPGAYHGFAMTGGARVTRICERDSLDFLRRVL
jgi:acetyl esterase/lipase